jgi:catechol 2,3-dioxygenase-like lactoylglutathione lyase family enzyme
MRLRQICLVAHDLEKNADDLTGVLGLSVAFRDPGVARYGLANIVTPVGRDFLEIVSPTRPGTSAGRYLERRGGDGGYMVILQGDDALADRERLQAQGVRAVDLIERADYRATHFHPADTGGILLSIDSVPGGDWRNADSSPASMDAAGDWAESTSRSPTRRPRWPKPPAVAFRSPATASSSAAPGCVSHPAEALRGFPAPRDDDC